MKNLLTAIAFLFLFWSCDRDTGWNCTRKLGDETTEVRFPGSFTRIFSYDRINITYRYADSCRIEVTYGKNMIAEIQTSVSNGSLTIADNTTCNFVRNLSVIPEVVIYSPSLSYFENHSAADIITLDTLRSQKFTYQQYSANGKVHFNLKTDTLECYAHTGFTELILSGRTYKAALYTAATGDYDASRLRSEETYVNNTSNGDMYCVAHAYLYAEINRSGNIFYKGNPSQIQTAINGSGQVIAE